MRKILLTLSLLASTLVATTAISASPANATGGNCTSGTYNYREAIAGGCTWGNLSRDGRTLIFNLVVRDNVADGSCARVEVGQNVINSGWDVNPDRVYRTCGDGTSIPAQGREAAYTNTIQVGVRLCVGNSCTGWTSIAT